MKSSLDVEQGYIVHTHHSPTCNEEEYVLECDSRSYGCSMISRVVRMNHDTQDIFTLNICFWESNQGKTKLMDMNFQGNV
jgi:hypothetical protein